MNTLHSVCGIESEKECHRLKLKTKIEIVYIYLTANCNDFSKKEREIENEFLIIMRRTNNSNRFDAECWH